MTTYWRIGNFVIGIYLLFQLALWFAYLSPVDTEAIQETNQELLDIHLHQHLPKYYQTTAETSTASSPQPIISQ
ncbi:hypothetical protein [Tunicatimonas pelagia]|uniref:hypothetical protein n=1 Tax=Tunicatimonas pelagia TaxID=931531 RepID=UPI002664EA95|nr:hypothetical protein [Tunicatimonas pelagia]WKN42416.1 hypothetical protein P0M28_25600 [Tunicatimonas pelagia]